MKKTDGKTVAIIPARGGSKGIPRKNLKKLGGKPLVAWPIELALSISQIDRVIVSSEDAEIIKTAQKYGAEIPFVRPRKLANDEASTLVVLQHAIKHLIEKENYPVENVLLLYATTPFMRKKRVLEGIKLLAEKDCNSVVGMKKVRGLIWKIDPKKKKYLPFYPKTRVNRQDKVSLYEEAGNIFFNKAEVLLNQNRIVDPENCEFIEVEDDEVLDIDSPEDFLKAERRLLI